MNNFLDFTTIESNIKKLTIDKEFVNFVYPTYPIIENLDNNVYVLVDVSNSMMAFDYIKDALAKNKKNIRYFNNSILENLYKNPDLYGIEGIEDWIKNLPNKAQIIIFSDAGATRGFRNRDRINTTVSFLNEISEHEIIWINPFSQNKWLNSSAKSISSLVNMISLCEENNENNDITELIKLSSFPVGITIDMMYNLWHNFNNNLPITVVSDLLFSPIFKYSGGIFEMEKNEKLKNLNEIHLTENGHQKLYELAIFTKNYAQSLSEYYKSFKETLLLNANITLEPLETLKLLISTIESCQKDNNRSEILRLCELIEMFIIQNIGKENVTNSIFYQLLNYLIVLKGILINAPETQIIEKIKILKNYKFCTYKTNYTLEIHQKILDFNIL